MENWWYNSNFFSLTLTHETDNSFSGTDYSMRIKLAEPVYLNTSKEKWYVTCQYLHAPQVRRAYDVQNADGELINIFRFERNFSLSEENAYRRKRCSQTYSQKRLVPEPNDSIRDGFPHPEAVETLRRMEPEKIRTARSAGDFVPLPPYHPPPDSRRQLPPPPRPERRRPVRPPPPPPGLYPPHPPQGRAFDTRQFDQGVRKKPRTEGVETRSGGGFFEGALSSIPFLGSDTGVGDGSTPLPTFLPEHATEETQDETGEMDQDETAESQPESTTRDEDDEMGQDETGQTESKKQPEDSSRDETGQSESQPESSTPDEGDETEQTEPKKRPEDTSRDETGPSETGQTEPKKRPEDSSRDETGQGETEQGETGQGETGQGETGQTESKK